MGSEPENLNQPSLTARLRSLTPAQRRALDRLAGDGRPAPDLLAISPQPRNGRAFPLALSQQRLWLLARLDPASPVYNVPCHIRLRGELSRDALRKALDAILARHESLRTRFPEKDGEAVQVIGPPTGLPLPFLDLSGLTTEERVREISRLASAQEQQPFDLEAGPLLRAALLYCGDSEHVLLLTMHHIISDGWSMSILQRELGLFYNAFVRGRMAATEPLAVQYADYAVWQRQWLAGDLLRRQTDYWRRQLAGVPRLLTLPWDRPRPPQQTFNGATILFDLPQPLLASLKRISQETSTTMFMVCLALFAVFLGRYSGQDDLVVGVPNGGRVRKEIEPLIGFFVNSLAMRIDLSGEPSFRKVLERLRTTAREAYAHQDVPFEYLVEQLRPERNPAFSPIFQTWFVFRNQTPEEEPLINLTMLPLQNQNRTAKFDLTLFMAEESDRLSCGIEYNRDLFEEATILRMRSRLRNLAEQVTRDPDLPVEKITLAPLPSFPPLKAGPHLARLPLSYHQERLWFIDRFETGSVYPHSPLYHNFPLLLEIDGHLKPQPLQAAFTRLSDRHRLLRTRFEIGDEEVRQVVAPHAEMHLRLEEFEGNPPLENLIELALTANQQPLDLGRAPLARAVLFRGAQRSLLLVSIHQIISDPASLDLLARELAVAYAGQELEPMEQNPDYGDYLQWQRALPAEAMEPLLFHWRYQLRGVVAPLLLPTDRPRPAVHTYRAGRIPFRLDDTLCRDLLGLADTSGLRGEILLLATLLMVLQRYTGQEEIAVGLQSSCRDFAGENMFGPLANLQVLRCRPSEDASFIDFSRRLQDRLTADRLHEEMPFDRLVQELNPAKDMSRTALFDVLFTYSRTPALPLIDGLAVRRHVTGLGYGKYDLHLAMAEQGEKLRGNLVYNADLFDPEAAARLSAHYQRLLHQFIARPHHSMAEAELLDAAERHEQLRQWNETTAAWPDQATLHQLFTEQAATHGDRPALSCGDEHFTYAKLEERANRLAHLLIARGVGSQELVGLLLPRRPELIVAILAVLKAGGAYLPLEPEIPAERLNFLLQDSGAVRLICSPGLEERVPPGAAELIRIDDPLLATMEPSPPACRVSSRDLAYCIHTSGSTGRPKGVLVEHGNVVRLLCNDRSPFSFTEADVWTMFHSPCFDFSVWEIFGALLSGGRLVLVSREQARDPALFAGLVRREGVTVLNQTPGAFYQLSEELLSRQEKRGTRPTLRMVIFGGEALVPNRLAAFAKAFPEVRLVNMYGITETTVHATFHELAAQDLAAAGSRIGRPIPTTRIYLLDQRGRLLPRGAASEMWIGGRGVARGYLNRPEIDSERFRPDPFWPGERMYRSGDLARYLPDGSLEYLGRKDQQVKIRGYRIEPGEIENHLLQHPEITGGVVAALDAGDATQLLVAYYSSRRQLTAAELRDWLVKTLPSHMLPSHFVALDQIPLTANGKVDRAALPRPVASEDRDLAPPEGEVEEVLADMFRQLLNGAMVGRESDFFELGGHSLLATRLVSQIRRRFEIELPVQAIFEQPRLADLAGRIAGLQSRKPPVLPPIERIPREAAVHGQGGLPLSFAQQRLWFLDRLVPGNPFYNCPAALRLRGRVERRSLELVFNELVRRHETLRTRFLDREGRPLQWIDPPQPFPLAVQDLRRLDPATRLQEARRLTRVEADRPFDLSRGPLMRAQLIRLADEDYLLLLTLHHIISDGWSLTILHRELTELYQAFVASRPSPLAELPVQYADFAAWQRRWLSGGRYTRQLDYWRRQLHELAALELPTDQPRPEQLSYLGGILAVLIPAQLRSALEELARRQSATLYMTMLAVFMILLRRTTGQDDIVVGSPVANRTCSEIEGLIGFFVNTLVLRGDLTADPTFNELLAQVRQTALDAYAHQDIPFEQLVDELQPPRLLNQNPLVQVIFALHNHSGFHGEIPGLEVSAWEEEAASVRFDLEVHFWEDGDGLAGRFIYNRDLFAHATIDRLAGHFHNLLTGVVADPAGRISLLPLLDAEEIHRLEQWSGAAAPYPAEATLAGLFRQQAAERGEAVALRWQDGSLSYRELAAQAEALATILRGYGVGPDILVAVAMERSPRMITALLGIILAGGAYLPLDPSAPAERQAAILGQAAIGAVLADPALTTILPEMAAPVFTSTMAGFTLLPRSSPSRRKNPPATPLTAESLAYVSFTSGSSGAPKGVMIPQQGVIRLVKGTGYADFSPAQVFLHASPLAFDASTFEIWGPLLNGGCLALLPTGRPSLAELGRCVRDLGVTSIFLTTGLFHLLVEEGPGDFASVQQLLVGGEVLSPRHVRLALQRLPGCRLINCYGPTESTTFTCTHPITPADCERPSISIGKPLANTRIYILDQAMQHVPIGTAGQLCIGGDGLARGYLGDEALTSACFVANPFAGRDHSPRLYLSGDRARFLADGSVEFLGRLDQQLKIRGFRVEPAEIEMQLRTHPQVADALVLPQPTSSGNKQLCACIVPRHEAVSAASTRTWQQEHLEHWRQLYEETYGDAGIDGDDFNIVGWNSSYTKAAIPRAEMREWLVTTGEKILALQPGRVLEIGSGTGMIMAFLAPHCRSYLATDYSPAALQHLERLRRTRPRLGHVEIRELRADRLQELAPARFDTVILNSVVQYFPGIDYFRQVLRQISGLLAPGGYVFLGDIRNLKLLTTFHLSLERHHAEATASVAELRQRAARAAAAERELLIDPELFLDPDGLGGLEIHSLMPKGGGYDNELSRFRYDLLLRKPGPPLAEATPEVIDWRDVGPDCAGLVSRLAAASTRALVVTRIPNPILQRERSWEELICRADRNQSLAGLAASETMLSPNPPTHADLQNVAAAGGWQLRLFWPEGSYDNLESDAYFSRPESPPPLAWPPNIKKKGSRGPRGFANNPLLGELARVLMPRLRAYLGARLPDYMLPAAYTVLESFPLTANGKIDRVALADPRWSRPERQALLDVPRTATEEQLVRIWQEVLNQETIGIHDNFFELGGHSLLATQVVSRIRRCFGRELPVRCLFEAPTIAALAPKVTLAETQREEIRPRPQDGPPPLSYAQQRLWFLDRLEQGGGYTMPLALDIRGPLDISALEGSLADLVARHEVLRTLFDQQDGEPVQRILPDCDVDLPVHDLSSLPEPERIIRARELSARFFAEPFSLDRGPLLRLQLIRFASEEHRLLLALHHIVADGWSLGILIREMAECYDSRRLRRPASLPPLPIQYADYACWQKTFLQGEVRQRQLAYWRRQLDGLPELQLPLDRSRPARQTFAGARFQLRLPIPLSRELETLSTKEGCSLFMTLLTGFMAMLGRYSGQEDFAVGSPIANRHYQELEGLIGFFVNTLVLRADLRDNPSFSSLLARVRQMTLDAYAHQDIPFEQLVETLQPQRRLDRNPLFQVLFALQNTPPGDLELEELRITPVEPEEVSCRFDLELHFFQEAEGLRGEFIYNPDLFEHATIRRMADHLLHLLITAAAEPRTLLTELSLLSPGEEAQLAQWNATGHAYAETARIEELVADRAARSPEAPAVACGDLVLSYHELHRAALRLAARLRRAGVGPGVPVGVYCDRSPELIIALLAVLHSGGCYVPLDPSYPGDRLAFILEDAQVRNLLSRRSFEKEVSALAGGQGIEILWLDDDPGDEIEEAVRTAGTSRDLAYILYTSGSTGRPKGVAIEHRSVVALLDWAAGVYGEEELRRVLAATSVCFDLSVFEIFLPLSQGGCVVLVENGLALKERPVEVTLINTVPSVMRELVRHRAIPETVRTVNLAGEPLKGSLVREIFAVSRVEAVYNLYGPSEDTTYSTWVRLGRDFAGEPTIGVPISNTTVHVLDSRLRPLPIGAAGELCLGGHGLARSYVNRPELTAARFVANPFAPGRLYRTGDLVRFRSNGQLAFLGRLDQQVKLRGYRIEPGEIEAILSGHPAVNQCLVTMREVAGEEQLVAYAETGGEQPSISELRAHLAGSLPGYMIPARFVLLEHMPLTPNGKIDRNRLPEPPAPGESRAESCDRKPQPGLEEEIAAIFAQLLHLEEVGRHDNFFELGGHSLMATRVISRLQEQFAIALPLAVIFEAPSVAELACRIESVRRLFNRPRLSKADDEEEITL